MLNFLKAIYILMSLFGSLPVSMFTIMALPIKFSYQREVEVIVGKSLQAFLSGLVMAIIVALAMAARLNTSR